MTLNETQSAFVCAIRLDGHGHGTEIGQDELIKSWPDDPSPLWMHLDFRFEDAPYFLETLAGLGSNVSDALMESAVRPRVAKFPEGIMATLQGINLTEGNAPDDLVSVRIWMSGNRLITLRRRPLKVVQEIRETFPSSSGPTDLTGVVAELSDRMVDQLGEFLLRIDQSLSSYEEQFIDGENVTISSLAQLRRPMITLNRFVDPQLTSLTRLIDPSIGLTETYRLSLREVVNHMNRCSEDLKALQDRITMLQDQIINAHSDLLNSRMYLMSFISVIFLPLSFLTGLLGINVGGLPGASDKHAFYIVVIICAIISILIPTGVKFWQWRKKHKRIAAERRNRHFPHRF